MPLLDQGFLTRKQDDQGSFSARVGLVALKGSFTVASSTKLINMLGMDIQEHEVVILDFSDTVFMDDSAALVVEQMLDIAATEEVGSYRAGFEGLACYNPPRSQCTAKRAQRPVCDNTGRC